MQLREPRRIDFSLAYPNPEDKIFTLSILEDSFILTEKDYCTLFRYESKFVAKASIIGWIVAKLIMKQVMSRHMDDHVLEIKELCETRASRSKLYHHQPCNHTQALCNCGVGPQSRGMDGNVGSVILDLNQNLGDG